ncbi:MAG: response regulator [Xanthobacteraceae bacterium]
MFPLMPFFQATGEPTVSSDVGFTRSCGSGAGSAWMNQGLAAAVMSEEDAAMSREYGSREDSAHEGDPARGRINYGAAPAADPAPNRIVTQPAAQPLPQPSSLRILAVDDDPLVLMNVTALLEDLGHSVVEAPSGKAALEILRGGHCIDLLVTDQSMPGMTGVELAAAASDAVPASGS